MIEPACKSLAFVRRPSRAQAHNRAPADGYGLAVYVTSGPRPPAEIEPAFKARHDARGTVEKHRKLGERDWSLIIEAAGRVTLPQQLRDPRHGCRIRRLRICADRFSFRASAAALLVAEVRHRRMEKPRPTDWRVGPRCCARGIPDRESPTAQGCHRPRQAGDRVSTAVLTLKRIWLSTSKARSSLPGKASRLPSGFDWLRRREQGKRGRKFRIANSEQRAGARRFQHHLVAATAHIRKPRQHQDVGIAERRRSRPIIRDLRLDDDQVRALGERREAGTPIDRAGPIAGPASQSPWQFCRRRQMNEVADPRAAC